MSSLNLLAFVLVAFGANLAHAQVAQATSCNPAIKPVRSFDSPAYLGIWYEDNKIPTRFQNGTCATAKYSLNAAGSIDVINTQTDPTTNENNNIVGTATLPEGSNVGSFLVTFPVAPVPSSLWVLSTDYTTYSVTYSCTNTSTGSTVSSWILKRDPAADVEEKVNAIIEKFGLDKSLYTKTSQVNCKYAASN